jgi:crossover junction endodeoxyribonuclease RuvC
VPTTALDLDPHLVLGIDPGTIVVGYGAVRAANTRAAHFSAPRVQLVEAGVLRAHRERPLAERLGLLLDLLDALVLELRPAVVVVERAFTAKNPLTALRLGEGRGLAIAVAARRGCRVVERTPAQCKRQITGSGAATKALVARAVESLLGRTLDGSPRDATDALALALTELQRMSQERAAPAGDSKAGEVRAAAAPARPTRTRRRA